MAKSQVKLTLRVSDPLRMVASVLLEDPLLRRPAGAAPSGWDAAERFDRLFKARRFMDPVVPECYDPGDGLPPLVFDGCGTYGVWNEYRSKIVATLNLWQRVLEAKPPPVEKPQEVLVGGQAGERSAPMTKKEMMAILGIGS